MYERIILTLILAFAFGGSNAASFNCAKASTNIEKTICSTPELSQLDEKYGKLYKQAKSQLPPQADVKREAIAALKQRSEVCENSNCLDTWYQYRIFVLENKLLNHVKSGASAMQATNSTGEPPVDCSKDHTTRAMERCIGREVAAAEEIMLGYLNKSIERYTHDTQVQNAIRKSQTAWQEYAQAHCGAVWDIWRDGSIRNIQYLTCKLDIVHDRTYGLWETYLTFVDSTLSVAPQPFPVRANLH